jgi:hypothetical protein
MCAEPASTQINFQLNFSAYVSDSPACMASLFAAHWARIPAKGRAAKAKAIIVLFIVSLD